MPDQPIESHVPEFDADALIRARQIRTNKKRHAAAIAWLKKDNKAREAVMKEQ